MLSVQEINNFAYRSTQQMKLRESATFVISEIPYNHYFEIIDRLKQ